MRLQGAAHPRAASKRFDVYTCLLAAGAAERLAAFKVTESESLTQMGSLAVVRRATDGIPFRAAEVLAAAVLPAGRVYNQLPGF
jgi:hypothetical protein